MESASLKINKRIKIPYNYAIYMCVLLACLVPRSIPTFKIHLGINISLYTIMVVILWILTVRKITIRKRLEYYFFFIWAIFITLSVWRAEKIGVWAYYLDWILTAILFQQILIRYHSENTYEFIIKALTDALFIHLLIGLYEITAHTYLFEVGNVSRRLYGHVAIGMFHNLNDYATFVTTMLPFAIYRFLKSDKLFERLYCIFLTILSLYFMIVSESRGALLTLTIFVCAAIYSFARKNTKNTVITIVGLIVFFIVMITDLGGIKTALISFISRNSIDTMGASDITRINLIKNGLYFLKKTYGFGVGAGNLYAWLAEKSIYPIGRLRFIHNWYVEVLVTFGVFFFVVYLSFHIKILYKLWATKFENSQLKTTIFLSFFCFSIVSISSSSNVYSEWVWMYLVFVALFAESLRITQYSMTQKKQN